MLGAIQEPLPPLMGVSLTATLKACFLGPFLSPTVLGRVPPETDPEREIYMQEFHWGVVSGSTSMKKTELCRRKSVTVVQSYKNHGHPWRRSGTEMVLQNCPTLREEGWAFLLPGQPVIDLAVSRRDCDFGSAFCGWGQFPGIKLAGSCQIFQSWRENLGGAL